MHDSTEREESIFETARKLNDPAERRNYVRSACADSPDLCRRIEELLAADACADDFFAESFTVLKEQVLLVSERPGDRIGRYKLLEKIGEGGCGFVYMAEQEAPVRRRVALKVIKLGMDTRNVVARFEAERQALALMDHPNIAKVFDAGATETGRPFFVMELVRGTNVTAYCDQQCLSTEERLKLFLQICQAVQHAHQKGIIHRDLKPSNILVTVNDGVPVPKVIDFGIAKAIEGRLTENTLFTAFEQFLGTPAYTSPEQAALTSVDVDTRSDIYSLGVLLYELLTGKTPFDTTALLSAGIQKLRQTIIEEEAPTPSNRLRALPVNELATAASKRRSDTPRLVSLVQGDLDWIVMKCLEKDRARRYQGVLELAQDIQRHLNNEPLVASPPSHLYRVQKWVRRNRTAFTLGSMLIIGSLTAGLLVLYQVNKGRRIAMQSLMPLHVSNGSRLMNEGDLFGSLLAFTEALRLDAGDAKREQSHRIRIASVLEQCPKLIGVFGHEDMLNGAVFSPDDRRLLTGSEGGLAKVWDLSKGKHVFEFKNHNGPVYAVAYSPDNRLILTVSRNLHLWSAESGEPYRPPQIRNLIGNNPQPCFSPDSTKLLALDGLEAAQLWDIATGAPVGKPLRHNRTLMLFRFSPNGRLILTLTDDSLARVWDASTGELHKALEHKAPVLNASFSPDSRYLATVGDGRKVNLWDLSTGTMKEIPLACRNSLESVRFDPSGERLLTRSWDRSVQLWDVQTGGPLISPIMHDLRLYHTGFSPDGRRIITFSGGNLLQMWNAESGELLAPILRHTYWRDPVVLSSDGRLVATIRQNVAQVWDLGRHEASPLAIPPVAFFKITSLSANGRLKARIGGDNVLRAWDVGSAAPLGPPIQQAASFKQVLFGKEDDILVTETGDSRARIWDTATGQPLTPLLKTRADLNAPRISKRDLPRDLRPTKDLVALGQLLSGNQVDESGSFQPLESERLIELWTTLGKKYPDLFRSVPEDVFAWNQQEATASEQEWNWRSALFHLDRLIATRPEDQTLRHRYAYAELALAHAAQAAPSHQGRMRVIPPRDPFAPPETIDLGRYYNISLKDVSSSLASGVQRLGAFVFDLRGIVQLSGLELRARARDYPEQVAGIQIGRKCHVLRFLHASNFRTGDGVQVGRYVVHYSNGGSESLEIVYGKHLRSHWTAADEPLTASHAEIFWIGTNGLTQNTSQSLRAFICEWPAPDEEIASIDFISSMTNAAPFLIALTAN